MDRSSGSFIASTSQGIYRFSILGGTLGSTGTFGTPFYTADVDSGGDNGGRRNRRGAGPANDYEASSYGVGGGQEARSEGRVPIPGHGERVRP